MPPLVIETVWLVLIDKVKSLFCEQSQVLLATEQCILEEYWQLGTPSLIYIINSWCIIPFRSINIYRCNRCKEP